MSSSHQEPLGEGLAITILTPLMHYANVLQDSSDGGVQSVMLWVLINDIKVQMEKTFAVINTTAPNITVEVNHVQ